MYKVDLPGRGSQMSCLQQHYNTQGPARNLTFIGLKCHPHMTQFIPYNCVLAERLEEVMQTAKAGHVGVLGLYDSCAGKAWS